MPRLPVRALPLLLISTGCTPPADDSGSTDSETLDGVEVTISEGVPTVAIVTWTTEEPTQGLVRFGEPGALELITPLEAEPVTEHRAVLRGLTASRDYACQVEIPGADSPLRSGEQSFTTGPLPAWMPSFEREVLIPDASAGGYLLMTVQDSIGESTAVILDADAQPVWFIKAPDRPTRLRLSPDAEHLIVIASAPEPETEVPVEWFNWEGEAEYQVPVAGLHTDFDVRPDGAVVALGRSWLEQSDPPRTYMGETVVEITKDGGHQVIWDIFDHLVPDPDLPYTPCLHDETETCYSHTNFLEYDPEADHYLMTAAYIEAAWIVRGSDGGFEWVLSDFLGEMTDPDMEDRPLAFPHSLEMLGDQALIFDNLSAYADGASAAVLFDLDPAAGEARPAWVYATEERLVNGFLGNAQPLWNGNILAVFPQNGVIDEVSPEGEQIERITAEVGLEFRYATRIESLY
jgi:hypothetical protein